MAGGGKAKVYGYRTGEPVKPPNYDRLIQGMADSEIDEELLGGKGGVEYQAALRAERERRAVR